MCLISVKKRTWLDQKRSVIFPIFCYFSNFMHLITIHVTFYSIHIVYLWIKCT